jgi:hypothetical protein
MDVQNSVCLDCFSEVSGFYLQVLKLVPKY